ncbi:Phosphoribosylglycinamide formyltransferase [Flagellimonas maritima]|uniref:phosphoribosylglycinamide formyltransferase 1 n=1 Tax=Flagellimonas maritima TaxID=1383885 RepID=A0A2Z4LS64_9FLAO|nr:formyltransferase family protein [Allomuricauda aurantiaca]AWX44549.1 Phosphoribosylglycinamide formyltransferase [Allomuricauda aurantiaca]
MRLAFLFNYPMVDNINWKKVAIKRCLDLGHDVDVFYGKTHLLEYLKAYLIKRKFGNGVVLPKKVGISKRKNIEFFNQKGISVYKIRKFNEQKSIVKIANGKYDYLFVAIDHILSKEFVEGVKSRIVNVHYARLPEIRGMNAIEWNYLVNRKCELTLHYIDSGIDTGAIITKEEININKTDGFIEMRQKLQDKIPIVLEQFLKEPKTNSMDNRGGKLYTYMHGDLQRIIKKGF